MGTFVLQARAAPPRQGTLIVYPSPLQANEIVALLRARCRIAACFSSGGPKVFEAMLERRGIDVMALDMDTFADAAEYYDERIYCRQVRRIGVNALMHLERPRDTALLFIHCVLHPWRAYVSRYPEVPLLIVVGDDGAKKMYDPKPSDPADVATFRLLRRMPIDTWHHAPLTMAVYERIGS